MKKALPLLLLTALAGCGNYFSVRVPYQVPDMPGAAAARPALSSLYVTVKTAPPSEDSALGALAASLASKSAPEFRPAELARRSARALNRNGVRACAWSVDKTGAGDVFIKSLSPSGLLVLNTSGPSLSARKAERETAYHDKNKQKQIVKNKVWAYSASLFAEVKLYSWPDGKQLDSWADTFSYSEDRADDSKDPGEWYADSEDKLFGAATARLAARYAGKTVDRMRPVFRIKKDAGSEEAARLAQRNDWGKAEELWRNRAPAGGWRDYLGLAVAAELRKDYPEAMANYKTAQVLGRADKEAAPVRWEEIFRDLELASSSATASPCGGTWFGVKTALLPFTDQTTSVDGPPMVRQLLFDRLKEGGYDLVPLEETDEILRKHGFSDGGQLAAAKPAAIAAWLGAGRLISVDLTDFSEIMAGVYNRRMVKGSAKVWDAASGTETVFEESVTKVKTPKSFMGGMLSQLAKGLAERIKNKPLAYESGLFSQQITENLPNRR